MKSSNPLRYWKIILLMGAIFVVGFVSGTVMTATFAGKLAVRILRMDGWSKRTMTDLQRTLKLTPDQVEKIRPLVEKRQPQIIDARNQTFKVFGDLQKDLHQEILPLLTDRQVETLKNINRQREQKFRKAMNLAPPRGGPEAGGQ